MTEDEILTRFYTLIHNHTERTTKDQFRWIHPESQNPDGRAAAKQGKIGIAAAYEGGKAT